MRTALTLVYFQIYGKNLILFQFIKITHMSRQWGRPQNFLLAFIDELWKTSKIRFLKKQKKITNMYQKPQSYKVQFLRYGVRQFFYHFGAFFALYLLPNNPENQHFEKMKKASGYVITSNLCNKNHNQMIYAYSDMECSRHNFLSFWLFSHYWPQKSKFQKNVKTTWRYYPFTHVHHKSRSYVWFLWYKDKNAKAKVFCHFRPFFAFWPS